MSPATWRGRGSPFDEHPGQLRYLVRASAELEAGPLNADALTKDELERGFARRVLLQRLRDAAYRPWRRRAGAGKIHP